MVGLLRREGKRRLMGWVDCCREKDKEKMQKGVRGEMTRNRRRGGKVWMRDSV